MLHNDVNFLINLTLQITVVDAHFRQQTAWFRIHWCVTMFVLYKNPVILTEKVPIYLPYFDFSPFQTDLSFILADPTPVSLQSLLSPRIAT